MLTADLSLRLITVLLLLIRSAYWIITEIQAQKGKPRVKSPTKTEKIKRFISNGFEIFIIIQLLFLNIFSYGQYMWLQIVGFAIVLISLLISITARREIGLNWSHAAEYEIKKDHELVTSGIYAYIRNPIYTAIFLSHLGVEMVAHSYLVFGVLFISPVLFYVQAKSEEKILRAHFGKKYDEYRRHSKMFIPFIW